MKIPSLLKTVGAIALTSALAANLALAENPNPRVLPINSTAYGEPYGVWSGFWWQWAYSFPTDTNPVSDPTGEFAALGQSGPVWLLAGTFGTVADRTVTVPAGKAFFFPIINQVWVNLPIWGDPPWSEETEIFARSVIAPPIDNAVNLTCQIDGVAVGDIRSYRCQTPDGGEYMVTLPENNVWGLPAGTYGPCVDDGIWLMLAPLPVGQHTIHFTAAQPDGSWSLEVTYHLTVLK